MAFVDVLYPRTEKETQEWIASMKRQENYLNSLKYIRNVPQYTDAKLVLRKCFHSLLGYLYND